MSEESDGGNSIKNLINDMAAVTANEIGQWSQNPQTQLHFRASAKVNMKDSSTKRPKRNAESLNSSTGMNSTKISKKIGAVGQTQAQ